MCSYDLYGSNPIYGCTRELVTARFVFRASHFNQIIPQF